MMWVLYMFKKKISFLHLPLVNYFDIMGPQAYKCCKSQNMPPGKRCRWQVLPWQKMPPQALPRQQMPKATFSQPYICMKKTNIYLNYVR